ncbi:transposase [Arenibacter sp. NBRC 103722]|uniref:transposase n=1 Tax=Arenibacter sp. NBRC 103722 TaxID=1113929 RepID=UPI000853EE66|nr:transposase [Arenibacter sp. NBRC 103722]GBF20078.1 transposase [Arenibacter sp. NBRC 103722]|tara:strand:+ start:57 stop:335 length:279 start_codon:yes stop_codon:yes gene_type:complete
MKTPRRKFSASFKAKVAIEAIKEQTSLPELAAKFEIHPTQISNWKREFLKNADLAFGSKPEKEDPDVDTAPLYSKIGQLQVENDFLKKVLGK